MKNILLLALLFSPFYVNAQIKGDKNIVKERFKLSEFQSLYMGLYAQYEIDLSLGPYMEITIDENLLEFVERSNINGDFVINQLKWIQPSQDVLIKIGAQGLKKLTQSAHSRTFVTNVDQDKLKVIVEVGDMFLEGRVESIDIEVGTADVDASKLNAETGTFKFESWGTIKANVSGDHKSINKGKGKLVLNGSLELDVIDESTRFIKFVLRNNSANRHQFYVVGPKPDGSQFSYGFPMMPYQKRDKDWTNGTKVYKVNNIGLRKLVKVIRAEDEGEIVNIFGE